MKSLFKPTWYVNSIYDLNPENLKKHDIYGLICDLDNTLVPWNEGLHTEEMFQWIMKFKENDMDIFLVSNNNYERVLKIAQPLEIPFCANALKPFNRSFKLAIEYFQLDPDQIAVIGDQLMTDVVGANRLGIKSILVKPLVPNDNIYTWLNRSIEKIILKLQKIDRDKDWGNRLD